MKYILSFLCFIFLSQLLFGQIRVSITYPENNLVDTNIATVHATVTPGEYEITSVIATIDNRSVSLINIGPYFQGNLSTSGLIIGNTYVLTVTATDAVGNQATATKNVIVDPPPKINIQLPVNHEVATPKVHIQAAASDNSVCSVVVRVGLYDYVNDWMNRQIYLDTFINSVDTIIDLTSSWSEGTQGYITFTAIDSRAQQNSSNREIFVESSPYLEKVFSIEGIIKDFNYGKVLSYFVTNQPDNNRNSIITDINTSAVSVIPATIYNYNLSGAYGNLTPEGAVFFDGNNNRALMDWNNGSLYSLGQAGSSSLYIAGSYAIWSGVYPNSSSNLYLRNTTTRSTQQISTVAGNNENGIAANGTVAYWSNSMPNPADNGIYRYANGITTRIGGGVYPLTDGRLIVWGGTLFDGSTNISLGASTTSNDYAYRVSNGFVAYCKTGTSGTDQIWLRDTTGASSQITFYSTSSQLDVLAPNGSFSFNRNQSNSWRYLYDRNSNKFKALAYSPFGKMYYQDSVWYMSVGRVLYKINPNFINSYFSVKDGNWSNPATWYGNTVPPVGADVTLGNNVNVDIDATCNTLTVKSNALVTINAGINLTVLH